MHRSVENIWQTPLLRADSHCFSRRYSCTARRMVVLFDILPSDPSRWDGRNINLFGKRRKNSNFAKCKRLHPIGMHRSVEKCKQQTTCIP
jgi:hypothetical protein